jgi:hypothetical protein
MLYATLRPIPAWRRIPAANDPLPESGEPLIKPNRRAQMVAQARGEALPVVLEHDAGDHLNDPGNRGRTRPIGSTTTAHLDWCAFETAAIPRISWALR